MTGLRQLPTVCLGIWLIAAPAVVGYGGSAADNDRIVGPIVASIALISISEAVRGLRLANIVAGAWLVAAAFLLPYPSDAVTVAVVTGIAISLASLSGGRIRQRFGGGWSSLVRREPRGRGGSQPESFRLPDGRG